MDFEKICMLFTMQEPFYGIILSSLDRRPKPGMGTAGVGRSGNTFVLYYDPQWIESLPIDTALQVCRHECLHLAFNHFSLWEEDANCQHEQDVRNIAADIEVNSYIDKSKLDSKSRNEWIFADQFGWQEKEGTREYYSRLKQQEREEQEQQAQAQQPTQPCNGGQGGQQGQSQSTAAAQGNTSGNGATNGTQAQSNGSGNAKSKSFLDELKPMDDHSMWPKCDTHEQAESIQQVIDTLLDFAAEECEKGRGEVPGEIAGRIEKIRKKPKPVADWKRYFRRYLGNEFTEFIRKSKKRESRRFPDAAGNRHRRKSHILVAIDTSGSVSMPEYREFFGQIKTLTATADFHVVECDARIQHEYDFKGRPNEVLHGGGGTDFQPVVDLFNQDRRKYDALVYFTDGYCDIPKNTPKDTLWVISSEGDQKDRNKYKVNGASVAFIPKKQQ